ncbi:thioredoxin domain-containing protein [Tautonia sociabilis]|uniref:Thioredoxin domain-containing protein n=1 Tax=Tautonia sociabilis TaxID=2080755 RepID=A0A432MMA6_9BACT|nr:thioredoxin domain-containing protein [Tautonia sociabilis]RUL88573.1 hypothetical protein TsocGM_06530 [Tautonia sociabilis]
MTTAPFLLSLVLATLPAPASSPPGEAPAGASRGPAILDFHADWCAPCNQMRPRVELLARKNYPVRSIDVDRQPELAERFGIQNIPTFIILDAEGREVARREGIVEARELADLYRDALGPTPVTNPSRPQVRPASSGSGSARLGPLPDPWATVVRIRVKERNKIGYGSGTVIESNEDEAIILTCAHIFSIDGPQPRPEQFSRMYPVLVELFDGKLGGPGGQTVRPVGQPMPGEVIDYDFDRDVALVRIRPGRIVPSSRVVPPRWKPEARMGMYTVGCSHGEDATAWNTVIYAPSSRYQVPGKRNYDAIECLHSPKQGRSGGGLFTEDGYVAGVCNFAFDRSVGRGLYASPKSIYAILDRNNMSHLYEERRPGLPPSMIASNTPPPASRPGAGAGAGGLGDADADPIVRLQNDEDVAVAGRNSRMLSVPPIEVPPPEFFNITLPDADPASFGSSSSGDPRSTPAPTPAVGHGSGPVRSGWVPVSPGASSAPSSPPRGDRFSRRPASGSAASPPAGRPDRRDWPAIGSREGR